MGVMIGRCSLDSQHRDLVSILQMLAGLISDTQTTTKGTKLGDTNRKMNERRQHKCSCKVEGGPKAPFFNSYYTVVYGRGLLLSLHCFALPLIRALYCRVLSKAVSSTILKVFGMTRPGIEPRSAGPLANTLPSWPMSVILKTPPQKNV